MEEKVAYEEPTFVMDERKEAIVGELMRNVYVWMTGGLALTGVIAWVTANSPEMLKLVNNQAIMWILAFAELFLVIALSAFIEKMRFLTAGIMYTIYCAMNGLTLSFIFLVYELGSIANIFFVTAGSFAGLAFIGTVIKKDLSKMGTFLIIALFGLVIASIVGLILGRPESIWMSVIGVIIFAGLTVYDAQKIRELMLSREEVDEGSMKLALLGALSLYLDFINLLLRLLSLFAKKK